MMCIRSHDLIKKSRDSKTICPAPHFSSFFLFVCNSTSLSFSAPLYLLPFTKPALLHGSSHNNSPHIVYPNLAPFLPVRACMHILYLILIEIPETSFGEFAK